MPKFITRKFHFYFVPVPKVFVSKRAGFDLSFFFLGVIFSF